MKEYDGVSGSEVVGQARAVTNVSRTLLHDWLRHSSGASRIRCQITSFKRSRSHGAKSKWSVTVYTLGSNSSPALVISSRYWSRFWFIVGDPHCHRPPPRGSKMTPLTSLP